MATMSGPLGSTCNGRASASRTRRAKVSRGGNGRSSADPRNEGRAGLREASFFASVEPDKGKSIRGAGEEDKDDDVAAEFASPVAAFTGNTHCQQSKRQQENIQSLNRSFCAGEDRLLSRREWRGHVDASALLSRGFFVVAILGTKIELAIVPFLEVGQRLSGLCQLSRREAKALGDNLDEAP